MLEKISRSIKRHEKIIPLFLFLLFVVVTVPGVNWGVPALWNPDELVWRVDSALRGEIIFDETEPDFNYPSLPKYIMLAAGKVVYGLGQTPSAFFVTARLISTFLGALVAVLVYTLARLIGASKRFSLLAGMLYIASSIASANARFAHNDLYLQFFSVLCVYFAIKFELTKHRGWLYASFFATGLAASSKYTGGSLLLLPLFVLLVLNWKESRADRFRLLETLFIGALLSFGGFVTGTPKALLWMAYYFKRVIPALQRFSQYGKNSGVPIGLIGQWGVFQETVGTFIYFVFMLCFAWFIVRLILARLEKIPTASKPSNPILILIAAVIIFDLPFLVSVNYVMRFFIPFVPFLSILAALFIQEVLQVALQRGWAWAPRLAVLLLGLGIGYSMLRLTSTALLFMNDARMPASKFVASLAAPDKTIEYTLYPPIVNKAKFGKARNYPIYFIKYPGEMAPTGGKVQYNQGEAGLLDREVDYLVIDTLTYDRFYNDSVCQTNPLECDFFKRLVAGEISSYRLIKEFTYSLPAYLPRVTVLTVNPEIRIYERVR